MRTRGNILPCWEAAVSAFQGRILQQPDGGYTVHWEGSWDLLVLGGRSSMIQGLCLRISVHCWRPWSVVECGQWEEAG